MYPSDLSEQEWSEIADFFEPQMAGRPSVHNKRDIFNALLYIAKTGCQWRMLPKDFPPWQAVHSRYEYWSQTGAFERALCHLTLRNRKQKARSSKPALGIIDSQSVKTANVAEDKGFDGHKKNKRQKASYCR